MPPWMPVFRRFGGAGRLALRGGVAAVAFLACVLASTAASVSAAIVKAGPGDYRAMLRTLRAGDTLELDAGVYRDGLDVHHIVGAPGSPVTIRGAPAPHRSTFVANPLRNTVSIVDSAHVVISDLELRGGEIPVDAVKAEGHARFAHHIVVERLRIVGYGFSQQNVAISTKCPAWNWIIRHNTVDGAGTGLYLGDSDGSAPFVRGVIEHNIIMGSRGYAIQVKHQSAWPVMIDVPAERGETVIRYNTLVKDSRSSVGQHARPSLLLGHWPLAGRGASDRCLVYGNLLVDSPGESLMQAEGNVTAYNNVLVNRLGDGVAIREHHDVPRAVSFFNNTILARGFGLLLRNSSPLHVQQVFRNAIYSAEVTPGSLVAENLVRPLAAAGEDLLSPFGAPERPDLAPKSAIGIIRQDLPGELARLPDVQRDFDRKLRRIPSYGAYEPNVPARDERLLLPFGGR